MKIRAVFEFFGKSVVLKNSAWGAASSILQNLLLSLFFVIVARSYNTSEFARFLIANALYQVIGAFSALGLGQWFIREYIASDRKELLVAKFLKLQLYCGVLFYLVCIVLAYVLYDNELLRKLSLVLGVNIVLDNVIYVIKNLNIAQFEQRKTFVILLIDSVLRFLAGVVLLIWPFSVFTLAVIVILTRFFTLNLFLRIGVAKIMSLRTIWQVNIAWKDVKRLIWSNWSFIIIGSVAMIYWRLASIVISKLLTEADVASYEVSFKVFTVAQIIPLILSSTVFPSLVNKIEGGPDGQFQRFYKKVYLLYFLFGLMVFTFMWSFAGPLIAIAFGPDYSSTSLYTRQMFLTMLVFPTAYLQANVLVAMKLERVDMWINVISLIAYIVFVVIGSLFVRSLSVINYSIFASWVIFHLLQDRILVVRGVVSAGHTMLFYTVTVLIVLAYIMACRLINSYAAFIIFWGSAGVVALMNFRKLKLIQAEA